MMKRLLISILALTFVASSAFATPAQERAAERFEEGEAAFARRDFEAAALAFEEAAELSPHASAWLNAAEAWERAGSYVRAAEDCERALELADDDELRAEARARLDRLEPRISRLELQGRPSSEVSIDGGEAQSPPVARWLPPGRHVLVVKDEEAPERRSEITLAPGEHRLVDLEQLPEAPLARREPEVGERPISVVLAEPPDDASGGGGPPTASWVCFAAGGAALVAAAILGGLTLDAQGSYEKDPTQARADTFFARRSGTNVAWVMALIGAGTGVTLWALDGF